MDEARVWAGLYTNDVFCCGVDSWVSRLIMVEVSTKLLKSNLVKVILWKEVLQ